MILVPLVLVVLLEQWALSAQLALLDKRARRVLREIPGLKATLDQRVKLALRDLLDLPDKAVAEKEGHQFPVPREILGLKATQVPREILDRKVLQVNVDPRGSRV